MIKLYENIKILRKQNKWSQEELANKMGYTDRSAIAKIEAGVVDISESKIMAFAKIFGIKPSVLMGWDNPTPDPSPASPVVPVRLRRDESELLDKYNLLNDDGKREVKNHTDYIVSQDRFLKDSEIAEKVG